MRILLVSHYYPPEIGAPQRRWDALVERFTARGHRVAVLSPSPHYPSGRLDDDHQHLCPGTAQRGRHGELVHRLRFREYDRTVGARGKDQLVAAADAVTTGVRTFGRRHRPDVVIATVPGLPTLPAGLALRSALGAPLVLEMRDAWPDLLGARNTWEATPTSEPAVSPRSRWATEGLSSSITMMQRRAAAVVTTTSSFAEVLRRRGMRHVVTVRHGTSVAAVPSRARHNGSLRVLYAGTVGRSQGLESAVEATHICSERGVSVDLRIVGDGAQMADLHSLVDALGAPVTFLPTVPSAQMRSHYAWADSILVALRSWEPLRWTVPSKLYDALATGRHISGALEGEAAGIIERTRAGAVVPPEDPFALAALWERLAAEPAGLAVENSGRAWVADNADDDALATRYLELLEEVVRHG